jgi:hypothetical protein
MTLPTEKTNGSVTRQVKARFAPRRSGQYFESFRFQYGIVTMRGPVKVFTSKTCHPFGRASLMSTSRVSESTVSRSLSVSSSRPTSRHTAVDRSARTQSSVALRLLLSRRTHLRALAWFCFPCLPAPPCPRESESNFQFVCAFSRGKTLSPVKAVNNAAYLKEELP